MNGAFLELRLSKVLVVDDHTLIREAMRDVLSELDPGCVVLEAHDGAGALDLAERNRDMDLVLLDLTLPDIDGLTVLADLRGRYPTTAVVVLSGVKDRDTVTKAVGLGAVGYIPKSTTHEIMVNALRLVCSGGVYQDEFHGLSGQIARYVLVGGLLLTAILAAYGFRSVVEATRCCSSCTWWR